MRMSSSETFSTLKETSLIFIFLHIYKHDKFKQLYVFFCFVAQTKVTWPWTFSDLKKNYKYVHVINQQKVFKKSEKCGVNLFLKINYN